MLSLSEPIIKQETVSIVKANLKTDSAIINLRIFSGKCANFTEKSANFTEKSVHCSEQKLNIRERSVKLTEKSRDFKKKNTAKECIIKSH